MQTVVGMYRTMDEANKVKQALLSEGYSGGDVTVIDQSESNYRTGYEGTDSEQNSVGGKIKHFFQGLAGHDDEVHQSYTQGVSNGGALVAVNVSDGEVDRAAEVLQRYGAQDIQGGRGAGSYGSSTGSMGSTGTGMGTAGSLGSTSMGAGSLGNTGTTGADFVTSGRGSTGEYGTTGERNMATGEQVIPVVEEELVVGKRQVERGGVRVYSRVVSQPVSESVSLHDERVVVDRRTVNRPATDADFTDAGPIEVRAMGEEAVVGKAGRVVEEVVVGKTGNERTETVEDTVRRTEVDVEPVSTGVGAGTTNTNRTGNNY